MRKRKPDSTIHLAWFAARRRPRPGNGEPRLSLSSAPIALMCALKVDRWSPKKKAAREQICFSAKVASKLVTRSGYPLGSESYTHAGDTTVSDCPVL